MEAPRPPGPTELTIKAAAKGGFVVLMGQRDLTRDLAPPLEYAGALDDCLGFVKIVLGPPPVMFASEKLSADDRAELIRRGPGEVSFVPPRGPFRRAFQSGEFPTKIALAEDGDRSFVEPRLAVLLQRVNALLKNNPQASELAIYPDELDILRRALEQAIVGARPPEKSTSPFRPTAPGEADEKALLAELLAICVKGKPAIIQPAQAEMLLVALMPPAADPELDLEDVLDSYRLVGRQCWVRVDRVDKVEAMASGKTPEAGRAEEFRGANALADAAKWLRERLDGK